MYELEMETTIDVVSSDELVDVLRDLGLPQAVLHALTEELLTEAE